MKLAVSIQPTDAQQAEDFLKRYNVRYIIVGQLERAEYPGAGLLKFVHFDGQLWDAVYRDGRDRDLSGASVNVYHITTRTAWIAATRNGIYEAPSLASAGFIHCSTSAQVLPVARQFYAGTVGAGAAGNRSQPP